VNLFGRREAADALWAKLLDQANERAAWSEAQRGVAQAEVRRLTNVIIELRKEGYAHVPVPIEEIEEPVNEEILAALFEIGLQQDSPEWNRSFAWAERELARNVPVDRVVDGLLKGDDPFQYLD
jgi:hypothetical protein